MDDDRRTVLCQSHVKLYPVRAVRERALERDERVLRRDRRRAAMTDDENSWQWAVGSGQWLSVSSLHDSPNIVNVSLYF